MLVDAQDACGRGLGLSSGRESSNRWCFHVFLKLSEQKKHRKYFIFCALETQNHGIYDVFCLWYKNHSICKFFGQCLAKTLVFTRHCTLQYFGSALRVRGGGTEMTSNLLNNQVMGLASLRKAKLKVPPLELPVVISS